MDSDNSTVKKTYKRVKIDNMLTKLMESGQSFFVRRGTECNELLFDGVHNVYSTGRNNFPKNKIFLFNSVSADVKRFLRENPFIELPPKKNTRHFNYKYDLDLGVTTGTDLNHAYWRIAYVKGYISKSTYEKGLDEQCKALRLATLSTLGRKKTFEKYENGVFVENVTISEENEQLTKIFTDIRYSCFYMMYELSVILKDDFFCWKTDCIYYRDTPKNRQIVQDFFDNRKMSWKQLVYDFEDNGEDVEY